MLKQLVLLLLISLPTGKSLSQETTDCRETIHNHFKQIKKGKRQTLTIRGVSTDIVDGKRLMNVVFTFNESANKLMLVVFWEVDENNNYESFNMYYYKDNRLFATRYSDLKSKSSKATALYLSNGELCYQYKLGIIFQKDIKSEIYSQAFLTKAFKKLKERHSSGG